MMGSHVDAFIQTVARLRGPGGCPWDQEQTHASLGRYLLEECYEVLEAIHDGDGRKLREELGDLLLQIVLNAQVAKDASQFDIEDVAADINAKMIKRHPHVFADAKAENAAAVLKQWDELKDSEREDVKSALDGPARTLPALLQALKISERAVYQGFEWNTEDEIWQQLKSEIDELRQALSEPKFSKKNRSEKAFRDVELEFGDVLFTVVNLARWHAINAEEALLLAIEKFKKRFAKMEEMAPKPLKELSTREYEELWSESKKLV